MPGGRPGFSLLEVLVAATIILLATVPAISLATSSSAEVTKSRDRTIALSMASSLAEYLRAQRPQDRDDVTPQSAKNLPYLKPILEAHAQRSKKTAAALDKLYENITCRAELTGNPRGSRATIVVEWREGGKPRSFEMETRLEAE